MLARKERSDGMAIVYRRCDRVSTERRHFSGTSFHAKPRPNGCRLVVGRKTNRRRGLSVDLAETPVGAPRQSGALRTDFSFLSQKLRRNACTNYRTSAFFRYLFPRQTPPGWVPLGGGKKDKPQARLVGRSCRNPCRGPLGKAAHCGRAVLFFPKNFAAMLARTTERRHSLITSSTHKRRCPMGIAFCVVGRGRFELPKS